MPILKGTMGYTRFIVKSEAELDAKAIAEKLNLFKFKPLHPHGEDQETMGWCAYLAEYDPEKSIEMKDFLYDDKIVLSFRMDSISIPKDLLKAVVKKSVASYYKDYKKWPDKTVKKEIELAEAKAIRARILPKTKIIEAMWSQQQGELRVFCRSKSQLDQVTELFLQTFLLRPERRDFSYGALGHSPRVEAISHQPMFIKPLPVDVQ
jgi:DNA recombination-dependent growth factor C